MGEQHGISGLIQGSEHERHLEPGWEPPGVEGNEIVNRCGLGNWTGEGVYNGASLLLLKEWRGYFTRKLGR